jgi:hypothetical protein
MGWRCWKHEFEGVMMTVPLLKPHDAVIRSLFGLLLPELIAAGVIKDVTCSLMERRALVEVVIELDTVSCSKPFCR